MAEDMPLPQAAPSSRSLDGGGLDLLDEEKERYREQLKHFFETRVYQGCLSRKRLAERLEIEQSMVKTSAHIALIIVIFIVLFQLGLAGENKQAQRGSRSVLEDAYRLAELAEIQRLDQVKAYLAEFSAKSTAFSPASMEYMPLETNIMVQPGFAEFAQPAVQASLYFDLTRNFTFTAWVKMRPPIKTGSILAKMLDGAGGGPCWRWQYPASFQFGAADFGYDPAEIGEVDTYHNVVNTTMPPISGQKAFVALVVAARQVTFYHYNDRMDAVGYQTLPRDITDCEGSVQLGDTGMMIGQLAFRPRALNSAEIEEILGNGATLQEIAVGTVPRARLDADHSAFKVSKMLTSFEDTIVQNIDRYHNERAIESIAVVQILRQQGSGQAAAVQGVQVIQANATDFTDGDNGQLYIQPFASYQFRGTGAHMHGMPRLGAQNRGFSISAWLRTLDGGAGYVLSKHTSASSVPRCYGAHMVQNRLSIYVNRGGGSVKCLIPEPKNFLNENAFRHVAYVMAAPNTLQVYLDGELLCEKLSAWPTDVADLDSGACDPGAMAAGMRYPDHQKLNVDIEDLRVYREHPLTASEVRALAMTGRRECRFPDEMNDMQYLDWSNRDCGWYQAQMDAGYLIVCKSEEAKQMCPVACKSVVPCYLPSAASSAASSAPSSLMHIWNRILSVPARTFCVSQQVGGAKGLAQACRADAAGTRAAIAQGMRQFFGASGALPPVFSRLNASANICDEIEAMADPKCDWGWDDTSANLSSAINATGEFSLLFWRRGAVGEKIVGFSGHGPLTPVFVLDDDLNRGDQYHTVMTCASAATAEVYGYRQTGNSWTHYGLNVKVAGGQVSSAINGQPAQDEGGLSLCLQPDIFSILYFEEGGLMSPVRVFPQKQTQNEMQLSFYKQRGFFKKFPGALVSSIGNGSIPVAPYPFNQRLVLLGPPLVAQERVREASCTDSASWWYEQVLSMTCRAPWLCPAQTMKCRAEDAEKEFFGIEAEAGGFKVLASTISAPALRREGSQSVIGGTNFVDLQTKVLSVSAIYYLPLDKTITNLQVKFLLEGTRSEASYTLKHISVGDMSKWIAMVIFAFILLGIEIVMMIYTGVRFWYVAWKEEELRHVIFTMHSILLFSEIVLPIILTAVLIDGTSSILNQGESIEAIVRQLADIPWGESNEQVAGKMQAFFAAQEKLLAEASVAETNAMWSAIRLVLLIFRMMMMLHSHPRMRVITGTLQETADKFIHLFICVSMLYLMFCAIGVAVFSSDMPEFSTFQLALGALMEFMVGEFPENWIKRSWLFIAYFVLYLVVFFFFLLNFILAIVAEGYMRVQERSELVETEQNFLYDIWLAWKYRVEKYFHGWPSQGRLAAALNKLPPKVRAIGVDELVATGLFRSGKKAAKKAEESGRSKEEEAVRIFVLARRVQGFTYLALDERKPAPRDLTNRELLHDMLSNMFQVPELFVKEKALRKNEKQNGNNLWARSNSVRSRKQEILNSPPGGARDGGTVMV